jgi:S-adenosylmethionine hydrolase
LDGVALVGEVIYVDRFGTLVTNIPGTQVEPGVRIKIADTDVGPLRRTYGDVERGQLVAYVGSNGEVEVAAREGSAVRLLGVGVGATVRA